MGDGEDSGRTVWAIADRAAAVALANPVEVRRKLRGSKRMGFSLIKLTERRASRLAGARDVILMFPYRSTANVRGYLTLETTHSHVSELASTNHRVLSSVVRCTAEWAASSDGRALRSQCRGRGFDPHAVHQFFDLRSKNCLAEARAPICYLSQA